MNLDSILSVSYAVTAVLGFVLLVATVASGGIIATVASGDIICVVVGMGAVLLGVSGLEAREIDKSITQSREVK